MKHTTLFVAASLWLVAAPGAMAQVSVDSAHLQWHVPTLLPPGARLAVLTGDSTAQASPSPFTFSAGSWQLTLGGYFKLDLIHDFDANSSPDSFDPRSIPVDGTKGTNTRIHARETRLSLGLEGPAEGRNLKLFLEGDFYGTGNAFRLRHAYARYGALLAGQTWTTVMDEDNIPPTIDFETPLAAPFVRQGLLRVTTGLSKRSELAFAVEESDPEILIPLGSRERLRRPGLTSPPGSDSPAAAAMSSCRDSSGAPGSEPPAEPRAT